MAPRVRKPPAVVARQAAAAKAAAASKGPSNPVMRIIHDAVVAARAVSCKLLATLVCWVAFAPSIRAFKARQAAAVKRGTDLILSIQAYRRPWLDAYFTKGSFFGEEDFYLVILPALFWNWDANLARGMTFLVCFGIFFGNLVKDLFEVPRPPSPPVWIPHRVKSTDSTALRDYGFPSTHSVNGITNPGFAIMYYWHKGDLSIEQPTFLILMLAAGFLWCASLCVGRLYLGVHSPSDVQGGIAIGATLLGLTAWTGIEFDAWVMQDSMAAVWIGVVMCIFLLIHPQHRPMNPTFIQNCLLAGLVVGAAAGCKAYGDNVWFDSMQAAASPYALAPSWANFAGSATVVLGVIIRTAVGLVMVFASRFLCKALVAAVVKALFNVKLGSRPADAEKIKQTVKNEDLVIGLEACSKFICYGVIAWSITHPASIVIEVFNLDVF